MRLDQLLKPFILSTPVSSSHSRIHSNLYNLLKTSSLYQINLMMEMPAPRHEGRCCSGTRE